MVATNPTGEASAENAGLQLHALHESHTELQQALQHYAELYDRLPVGCLTLAANGLIRHANLTAASWLRCARERLPGMYLTWFLDAFDAGRLSAHLGNCLETDAELRVELTLRVESGLLLTVELASRALPRAPQDERCILATITQLTRLRQSAPIWADVAREKQLLDHAITQELREPLALISRHTQDALRARGAELPAETKLLLERIEAAAVRAEGVLQQLLGYAALGPEPLALDPVSLDELVQHVLIERRSLIAELKADVTVARPLPSVRGARLVLGQVLSHLLTYALKVNRANGAAPRVDISAEARDGRIVLKLFDHGLEIPSEQCEQLFRVFEQPGGAGIFTGSGIALALIRRAIERMGGNVWVESAPAQGSCFQLALPGM